VTLKKRTRYIQSESLRKIHYIGIGFFIFAVATLYFVNNAFAGSPPPTVTITSPIDNAMIYSNNVAVDSTSTANDGGSITSSELLVDNNLVQTLTSSPYNFSFSTLGYSDGTHTVTVQSTDDQRDIGTTSVTVFVTNGDLNHSGYVNISDLAIMASNWSRANATYAQGNISGATGADSVNISDLAILAANWDEYLAFGTPTTNLAIHANGDQLVNGMGAPLRLLGVDASGTEDACIMNDGFSWGSLSSSEAEAMTTWHIDAVRVPLNEDCWLGINGAPASYSGQNYQDAIENWVTNLNNAGIIAILDLHWSAPGTYEATQQWPMADADHTRTFWTQVATAFKSNPAVVFDVFNEPFIGGVSPTSADWSCWLNGCSTSFTGTINGSTTTVDYTSAGMQQLVNAVRSTGAAQPIMVGGLNWSGDPCGIKDSGGNGGECIETANMPTDPLNQLVISFHTYSWTACATTSCWNTVLQAAQAANLPIITGEVGEDDCSDNYINSYMDWADQNFISYLAWSWEINYATSCSTSDSGNTLQLLENYSGTPSPVSPEAADLKAHLIQENPQ
jgi:endoglucanase